MYDETDPPLFAAGPQLTVICSSPTSVHTGLGDPGTLYGWMRLDWAEDAPAPEALFAVTVKRYRLPAVRPVTVQLVAAAPAEQLEASEVDVTV